MVKLKPGNYSVIMDTRKAYWDKAASNGTEDTAQG